MSAEIPNRLPGLAVLQVKGDLVLGEPGFLHRVISLQFKGSGSTLL